MPLNAEESPGSPTMLTNEGTFFNSSPIDIAYNSQNDEFFIAWQQPRGLMSNLCSNWWYSSPHRVKSQRLDLDGRPSSSVVDLYIGSLNAIDVVYSASSNEYLMTTEIYTGSGGCALNDTDLIAVRVNATTLGASSAINVNGLELKAQVNASFHLTQGPNNTWSFGKITKHRRLYVGASFKQAQEPSPGPISPSGPTLLALPWPTARLKPGIWF